MIPSRHIERYEPFGDIYFAHDASNRLVGALRRVGNGSVRGKYVGSLEIESRRSEVIARIDRQLEERRKYVSERTAILQKLTQTNKEKRSKHNSTTT